MMGEPATVLQHLRVIDLATFIAAPFCGTLLAEFGADVVKVELPGGGDSLRTLGAQERGHGLLWLQESRNKRSVTCNLKVREGQTIVRDLVAAGYDIVLENFRPGTLEKWGLGYAALKEINPRVILVRVSGYGQTGPYRRRPAFGRIAQAFAGLTYLCGFEDRPPANPGSATLADYVSGLFAAFGVLVACQHRDLTGIGQVIDVALYESMFRILDSLAITYSVKGTVRERSGTGTPLAAPHNHYPTADGKWVAIACTNDRIFKRLAHAMKQPELVEDSRFKGEGQRVANREAIDEVVASWTNHYSTSELTELLDRAEVPCSPICSIADIFQDQHYRERGTLLTFHHPVLGELAMPGIVPRFSASPGSVTTLGPDLGEHTDTVLRGTLGYSDEKITALRHGGVI